MKRLAWVPGNCEWRAGRGGDEWHRRPLYFSTRWGYLLAYLHPMSTGPEHPAWWIDGKQGDLSQVYRSWCSICRAERDETTR